MQKVYNYLDDANCAYLLRSGQVYFEIKEGERFKLSSKNLIVGASEVILGFDSPISVFRVYNFYKDDDADLAEISPQNLRKLVNKYSVGYNLNIFFARMIKLTNDILTKRQSSLDEDSKTVQQIAKSYFKITEKIQKLAQTTKFPDVIKLANGLANELIYETGKIFSQEKPSVSLDVKPDKMDEFSVAYPPNAIICKMGEAGKDMYILNSGRIAVLIQDKQVAEINIRGTVIGEIALLLGETRSATLKAIDQVSLSVVKKDNLEDFHSHHEDLFLQIGVTLSQRIHNNIQQIRNIDKQLEEKKDEKVAGFLTREKAVQYLKKLYKETLDLYDTKEYEQLSELIDQARTSMEKFEK